jgi:dTDP-4-amino-4,6-dideoxygalactose transaminase
LDLPEKSNIAVADNAGGYASLAVLESGHVPVFCDVSEENFQINVTDLQSLVGLKAVVVTHLYGQAAKIQEICEWSLKNSIYVIEDVAQALGAQVGDKKVGTFGDIACFSFYPTKNLGGIGDGGAVASDNSSIIDRIRVLKQYGWSERYKISTTKGRNSRLDAINAAVLTEKLVKLDAENYRRRLIYEKYLESDFNHSLFRNRNIKEDNVVHLAIGTTNKKSDLIKHFQSHGVQIGEHYPHTDSSQSGLNYLSILRPTPIASMLCKSNVSIPIYPNLTDSQIEVVRKAIYTWNELGE